MVTEDSGGPQMLLFADGPPAQWQRAAAAVANSGAGLGPADATRVCRTTSGFLEVNLDAERMTLIERALEAAGFPVLRAPATARAVPPVATPVLRARLDAEAFAPLQDAGAAARGAGPAAPLRWDAIDFLYAARVDSAVAGGGGGAGDVLGAGAAALGGSIAAGSPVPIGRSLLKAVDSAQKAPSAVGKTPVDVWLDLISAAEGRRLRVRLGAFAYDCLPPPIAPVARVNFGKLVAAIFERAPRAARSGLVEKAARGQLRPEQEAAISDDDFDRNVCFLLTRRALARSLGR